jgi:hypothetical protein
VRRIAQWCRAFVLGQLAPEPTIKPPAGGGVVPVQYRRRLVERGARGITLGGDAADVVVCQK